MITTPVDNRFNAFVYNGQQFQISLVVSCRAHSLARSEYLIKEFHCNEYNLSSTFLRDLLDNNVYKLSSIWFYMVVINFLLVTGIYRIHIRPMKYTWLRWHQNSKTKKNKLNVLQKLSTNTYSKQLAQQTDAPLDIDQIWSTVNKASPQKSITGSSWGIEPSLSSLILCQSFLIRWWWFIIVWW